jgi:hypothetical protein
MVVSMVADQFVPSINYSTSDFHNRYDRALMRTYYVCVLTVGTVYTLRDRAHWVPLVVFFLTWSAAIATSRKIVELEPRLLRQQKQVTQDL